MIPVSILGTGAATGGELVPTATLAAEIGMDPTEAVARTGISQRYRVREGEDITTMAAAALKQALEAAGIDGSRLARLILVGSGGGDVRIPATANRVLGALGIGRTCDAFDLNNACTGFLSAFDIAARCVATGMHPIAIVAAERFSDVTGKDDPRPYLVMGDAAAAVIVGPGREGEGIEHAVLRNAADFYHGIIMEHAEADAPSRLRFLEKNRTIGEAAIGGVVDAVRRTLAGAGLTMDDIDWIVPHQPNGRLLDAMVKIMRADPAKVVPVVDEIGSVGAASAPYSLDRLMRSGKVRPGQRLLLCAVGAGMSYGAIVHRIAA